MTIGAWNILGAKWQTWRSTTSIAVVKFRPTIGVEPKRLKHGGVALSCLTTSEQSSFAKRYWRFDQLWKALDFYRKVHHFMCRQKWEWHQKAARLRPWCWTHPWSFGWSKSWEDCHDLHLRSILREAGFEDTDPTSNAKKNLADPSHHRNFWPWMAQRLSRPSGSCWKLKVGTRFGANRPIPRWKFDDLTDAIWKNGLTPPGNFETRFVVVSCHSLRQNPIYKHLFGAKAHWDVYTFLLLITL